ncbi:MAG: efflux RND transporter periplasmic adaptor subunit [Rhodothalassiaceae bacterium]
MAEIAHRREEGVTAGAAAPAAPGPKPDATAEGGWPRWAYWAMAAGLLLFGVGGAVALYLLRDTPDPQQPPPQAPYVETGMARAQTEPLKIIGNGVVQPLAEIGLSPQVGGKVVYVHPKLVSGGVFQQGEVLIRLEQEDFRNQLRMAQARVEQRQVELQQAQAEARIARQEVQRLRQRLSADGAGAAAGEDGAELEADFDVAGRQDSELEPGDSLEDSLEAPDAGLGDVSALTLRRPQLQAARAALQSAQAQVDDAQLALDRATIEAPFDGHVRSEDVDLGQFVQPGQELARIYGSDAVEVVVPLTSNRAALIPELWALRAGAEAQGAKAMVTTRYGGRRFGWDGVVDRAKGFIDDQSRTVDVVVRVPDPFQPGRSVDERGEPTSQSSLVTQPPLLVGFYTTVFIQGEAPERYLSIPADALQDGDSVWALSTGDRTEQGEARLRIVPVTVILRADDRVAIAAPDLADGTPVVTSPIPTVTDGMTVRTRTEDRQDQGGQAQQAGGSGG